MMLGDIQASGFKYALPTTCLSAYRLIMACADAALALPYDPTVPGIEDARKALNDIVANPESIGIPSHWFYLAGVYEGPTFCLGDAPYDAVAANLIVAKAARDLSAQPEPDLGPFPRGQNPIAWSLKQLLAALGLPEWTLPAIGYTALAGAGVWTYFTFIRPALRASKVLTNPRRRIRRRRR